MFKVTVISLTEKGYTEKSFLTNFQNDYGILKFDSQSSKILRIQEFNLTISNRILKVEKKFSKNRNNVDLLLVQHYLPQDDFDYFLITFFLRRTLLILISR